MNTMQMDIKDCSNPCKKIKSTFKAKGEGGKHVASSPPDGYLKMTATATPDVAVDKNKWVIDEVAAPIVN